MMPALSDEDAATPASQDEAFDPAAWLAAFTGIGGGYALTSGRRLVLLVSACDNEDLAMVMSHVVRHRGRQAAVISAIERHQAGEA